MSSVHDRIMDVSQKLKRIRHNLVNSSKKDRDENIKAIAFLEARNTKILNSVSVYRKDLISTIKTGLKEENIEKRKKKLEEFTLALNLREAAAELEATNTTCIHKVMEKMSSTLNFITEEKVKSDKNIEERIIDYLIIFSETEKTMLKNKERYTKSCTDFNIAQKALDKEPTPHHQEAVDIAQLKMESQKDTTIIDTYTLATREQEIAKVVASYVEEKLQYHRVAMMELQKLLPVIHHDIDNARPRPMFGVDLTEHLRHYGNEHSIVIDKCCGILRRTGFKEKGLFRVNGNNSKIRRMKLAFDSGMIDIDDEVFLNDPHSVCSTLKSYLRELPDPLLTNGLYNEWSSAVRKEGEERLQAFARCLEKLPQGHYDNLRYFMRFLNEMLQHQDVTSMNASNIAIVMGPNLLGIDLEGNNSIGTKIVELLLLNCSRFFGGLTETPPMATHLRVGSDDLGPPPTRNDSTRFSPGATSSPRLARPRERAPPPPEPELPVGASLIDIGDNGSVMAISQHSVSESPEMQPSSLAHFEESTQRPLTDFSDDSFDEYDDEREAGILTRTVGKPNRPPPPAMRQGTVKSRPMSYQFAVNSATEQQPTSEVSVTTRSAQVTSSPTPPYRNRTSMVVTNPLVTHQKLTANVSTPVAAERSLLDTTPPSTIGRPKPPLPIKPKDITDKETYRL